MNGLLVHHGVTYVVLGIVIYNLSYESCINLFGIIYEYINVYGLFLDQRDPNLHILMKTEH